MATANNTNIYGYRADSPIKDENDKSIKYRAIIEDQLAFLLNNRLDGFIKSFFGIDIKANPEAVNKEELKRIIAYFFHLGKRIINHFLEKNKGTNLDFDSRTQYSEKGIKIEDRFEEFLWQYLTRLFAHDMSHATERVMTLGIDSYTYRPKPLDQGESILIDTESMEQELWAAIWQKTNGLDLPPSLELLSSKGGDNMETLLNSDSMFKRLYPAIGRDVIGVCNKAGNSEDDFIKAFIKFELEIKVFRDIHIEYTNRKLKEQGVDYSRTQNNVLISPQLNQSIHNDFDTLILPDLIDAINTLEESPDPKLVVILRRIYRGRDNPRILLDIFLEGVGPYIDRIEGRYKVKS